VSKRPRKEAQTDAMRGDVQISSWVNRRHRVHAIINAPEVAILAWRARRCPVFKDGAFVRG